MPSRVRMLACSAALLALLAPASAYAVGTTASTPSPQPPPAAAAERVVVPGSLEGLGFDACAAPDQATMDTLRTQSPFWGVGVYIGGENRTCPQPELTATWVRTQAQRGWRVFPVWAGRQSLCADREHRYTIGARNGVAERQGRAAADGAVEAALGLGMARGSTLFLDIEPYDNATSACNQPVMHFQSGWSTRLHERGWKSGFYSSGATGIASLDYVRATFPGAYEMPDAIWFAHENGKATTDGEPWVRDSFWRTQRVHQYVIDEARTYGDVTLQLDLNAIRIGRGSVAPPVGSDCGGVQLTLPRYRTLERGDKGPQVTAATCLLRQRGLYDGPLTERFTAATGRAVRQFQQRRGLAVTGIVGPPTWTALLAAGPTPLVKRGSAADRVRFLQRSLRAALGESIGVTGVVTAQTAGAVSRYQRAVGLDPTGVVTRPTWSALQDGRR